MQVGFNSIRALVPKSIEKFFQGARSQLSHLVQSAFHSMENACRCFVSKERKVSVDLKDEVAKKAEEVRERDCVRQFVQFYIVKIPERIKVYEEKIARAKKGLDDAKWKDGGKAGLHEMFIQGFQQKYDQLIEERNDLLQLNKELQEIETKSELKGLVPKLKKHGIVVEGELN